MTGIFCSGITSQVEKLASEYNSIANMHLSDAFVNNMISMWQTAMHTSNMPTAQELYKYYSEFQGRLESAYFAVPRHQFVEHNPNDRALTKTNLDTKIISLQRLPQNNALGYFFNVFKNYPQLQDVIETTEEAYQFLLWREQYFIMYNDAFRKDKKAEAFEFAYKKAKKWKEKHKVHIIEEDTNNNPQPSTGQQLQQQPQSQQQPVEPLPVTKIISGAQTGIDTLGLQIAREFGIPIGGNVPLGFKRENNNDGVTASMLQEWGLQEVNREEETNYLNDIGRSRKNGGEYLYRTYLNVRDSDGTVFFSSSGNLRGDAGYNATKSVADKLGKPFIVNPTAQQLRDWCNQHGIKTLNIAGSRGSHQTPKSTEIANNVLRKALAGNNKNAQQQQQAQPNEYKVEYKKNGQTYTIREDSNGVHIINKKGEEVYQNEDDGNRRMILAKLELQKGAVTVNYNGNVFIVKTNGEILSGADGKPVYQQNSEKQVADIHKLAEEKRQFYTNQQAQKQTQPQQDTTPVNTPKEETSVQVIEATIAPYRKTSYDDYLKMSDEEQKKMRTAFSQTGKLIADALGLELDMSLASINIGGYEFNDGENSIVEPSFTFRFKNATFEQVRLFSALMGDLGYEQQESVVTAQEVDTEDADCIKHSITVNDVDKAKESLDKVGIKNYTIDKTRKTISVLSFNDSDVDKLIDLQTELKNSNNGEGDIERTSIKSSLDDEKTRRGMYQEWLESQGQGTQQAELRGIIQRALNRLNGVQEDIDDLEEIEKQFNARRYQQAQQQQQQQQQIGRPAPQGTTAVKNGRTIQGQMNMSFGTDKRPEVVSTNTIDAIRRGERTATTRFGEKGNQKHHIDYWGERKVGDVVLFYDDNTNTAVYVRVTKELIQLPTDMTAEQIEEWSKKEGWSTDYFHHYIAQNVRQGRAWQMEYEYIGDAPMSDVKRKGTVKYTYESLTPEQLADEQAKAEALRAQGEHVTTPVRNITQAQANDPNYTPNIDISKVVKFNTDDPILGGRINLVRDFTSQQLKDRTEQMARDFSDILDSLVDEWIEERNEKINELFAQVVDITNNHPDQWKKIDELKADISKLMAEVEELSDAAFGKRFVIDNYGLDNILKDLKQRYVEYLDYSVEYFEEMYGKDRGAYVKGEYEKIVKNFDALVDDASIIIEGNENFRVVTKYINKDKGPQEGGEINQGGEAKENIYEKEKREAEFSDDENGSRLTGNDGWSYKVRFVDPLTSLSKDVRRVLGNIVRKKPVTNKVKKTNASGQEIEVEEIEWVPETDDLGNIKYLNPEATHAILISELSTMIDADDFMKEVTVWKGNKYVTEMTYPALEALVEKYPWVNQIIELLKQDERLASKFFHDFRKDFIPYWMQVFNSGTEEDEISALFSGTEDENKRGWKLLQVNKETALDSTITQITRNYEQGNVLSPLSIYTASKEISKKNAELVEEEVNSLMRDLQEMDDENYNKITQRIADVLRAVGLNTNRHVVSSLLKSKDGNISGKTQTRQLLDAIRSIAQGVQDIPQGSHLIDYFKEEGYYNTIAELIGVVSELDHVQSFRQFDKSYYSYSAPNYLDTCVKKLKDDTRRAQFLGSAFKQYDWFYKNNVWNSEWLRLIEEDADIRANLETKEINTIKLSKDDTDAEYKNWDESRIRQGFIREFFSIGINPKGKNQYAWYNVPIFSDSPVAKFIKFKRYTGDNYREEIIGHLSTVVKQEIERIKLVADRKKGIQENVQVQLSNFDKYGDRFHFFPELNDYYVEGKKFIEKIAELSEQNKIDEINALIATAVEDVMEENFQELLRDFPSNEDPNSPDYDPNNTERSQLTEFLIQEGAIATKEGFEEALRNYFYNQAFATTQIIELTTTDLAYYKNDTDFQKRFKEVYAAGNKLNTNSKYGKKFERVVYLSDQIITSATYNDIKRSLNYAVESGRIQSFDRDNILNKFKNINVADAQAYRSLDSMRSVLDMMGAWDDKMEAALQRFDKGDWDMSDFNLVWQTIKPFMFTQIDKPAYSKEYLDKMLADGRISKKEYSRLKKKRIKVPHQNKNSEFLLLSTYAMVANSLKKSAKLRGLERFMKDNKIDVIQFESAVKAGCQGTIDISYSQPKLGKLYEANKELLEKTVKQELRRKHEQRLKRGATGNNLLPMSSADIAAEVDKDFKKMSKFDVLKMGADLLLDNEQISQMQYNQWFESIEPTEQEVYDILNANTKDGNGFREEVVHELPYDDYCIQQPTPEHLFDVHNAVFGSQFRNLIIADLPEKFSIKLRSKGKEIELDKKGVISLYQANIVENLLDGYSKASEKFQNIRTLQAFLLDQVRGNPKYGRDILDALKIVSIPDPLNSGQMIEVFNIPLDNPTTSLKIQELMTSVFKNNVTKQTINGGAAILVSDFGLTKELQLRRDSETGAVTGIECYLPANSRQYYEPFMVERTDKETGKTYYELDIKNMPMELRKIVGYRIPTEDKYSMAPLIIKGFLPQQNGSSIMLPADITQIAGSDFDVDKMFLMIPSFRKINRYDMKEAWKDFYKANPEIVSKIEKSKQEWWESYIEDEIENNPELAEELELNEEKLKKKYFKEIGAANWEYAKGTKEAFEKWFKEHKKDYYIDYIVKKDEYDFDKSPQDQHENSKRAKEKRDNLLIDISYAILTHPDTAQKINDPGNFDKAKLGARVDSIITDENLLTKFLAQYDIMGLAQERARKQNRAASPTRDIVEAAEELISEMMRQGKLEELDEFIEANRKQRSQLTLNTFIYNHRQNMTGGALIGMYANNTTMQAKFQASELRMKTHRSFIINGRPLNSLHDAYTNEGKGERISKNCANFSAASVDNVKDPVLADLLQNRKTANITGFMLRAGMTVNEISLFFALPEVRKKIKSTGGLDPKTINNLVSNMRDNLESYVGLLPSNLDILKEYNVTSSSLMQQTIRETLNMQKRMDEAMENASGEARAQWSKERKEWEVEKFKTLVVFANIVEMAEPMGDLTRISRADSPNGAIDTSIAGATIQRQRVLKFALQSTQRDFPLLGTDDTMQMEYLKPDMSKDQMRDKLLKSRMPMLQAFYSLGIDLAFDVMSEHFSQASPFMQKMAEDLMINAGGYVKDWAINRFFNESVTFALSRTKLFGDDEETGDTYESKREYYLYQFPKKFEQLIIDNPDLKQIDIIKKLSVDQKTGDIQMFRSGRMTPLMRESVMRSMDQLLFDEDNPVAQKLAVDLFMYAYYKDGFRFGPNSFGTFFSSNFISSFPEVVNALRVLKFDMRAGTFMDKYLPQFYANHVADSGLPKVTQDDFMFGGAEMLSDGSILLKATKAINPLTKGGFHPVTGEDLNPYYEYIRSGNILYVFSGVKDMKIIYTPVYSNIRDEKGVRYNANSTARDMYEQLDAKARKVAAKQVAQSTQQAQPAQTVQPTVSPELSEAQRALAEQSIQMSQRATQTQSNPQQQARDLETNVGGSLDNIEGMSNSDATQIEQSMGDSLNGIEQEQAVKAQIQEYDSPQWQSIFVQIEEQQVQGFEEPPIVEQYNEADGIQQLDEDICQSEIDLPDF